MIKNFKEYINEGIVRKITPDIQRAKNLIKDSERKIRVLGRQIKNLGIDDEMSNEYVIICYDVLMLFIRAKMLLKGYNSSGVGAHEAEVSYLRILGFKEQEVQFANQMRFFRNGMLYYGTILDSVYAKKVLEFTKHIYFKLKNK